MASALPSQVIAQRLLERHSEAQLLLIDARKLASLRIKNERYRLWEIIQINILKSIFVFIGPTTSGDEKNALF